MVNDGSPDKPAAAAARSDLPAIDAQHPWLGLTSFTEETRGYFCGRDEEVGELARRVQRKLLTILFGQSGLGKTSILRAGIVPRLRPEGYCPIYVRIDYSPDSPVPSEQIKQAIYRETKSSGEWTQIGVASEGETLWEFLHHRDDVLRDSAGRTLIPLLIFDQFEEIFTLAQSDAFGRERAAQFQEDLADLVENRAPKSLDERIERDEAAAAKFDFARADYRILIALREDYLAHLEGLKRKMPSITQNRMRLARMTGAQALDAVMRPGGKLVSEEVAEAIVRFVAGGAELRNAEVEPSLLSLVCRELNDTRIAQSRDEISADLLAGSRDTILSEFYERALADQPPGVREVIEDQLLTESGYRESMGEERLAKAFATAGAPSDTLATLVNRRLLRIEERLDQRRVELTHDVLCGVVKASRDLRLERLARDQAEQQLEAQRERMRATRRALVRARQIAAVCSVLAIVAIGSAVFGYMGMKRAQQAEAAAEATRKMADTARGEAEKLIVYLLDDFYLELEPVGRLDIVAELSRRALDYYAALPPEIRTPETNRNRALALVRYGSVLRTQSKLAESDKALSEAVEVLGKMRSEGDKSETTALGLGLGLMSRARVADSLNERQLSRKAVAEAADVLRPLMAEPKPSIALRRAFGLTMTYLGFTQRRGEEEEVAVKTLEEAREAYRSIDGLKFGDLPSAAGFAEASAWQVETLQALGRNEEATRVGEQGATIAGGVLERRPGHMGAIRARALIVDSLSSSEADGMHMRKAVALAERGASDWEAMLRIDPSNQIAVNNLAASRESLAYFLQRSGRVAESLKTAHAALAVEARAKPSAMIGSTLSIAAIQVTALEAYSGNRRAAEAALADYLRLSEMGYRDLPANSFIRASLEGFGPFGLGNLATYALPTSALDWPKVRAIAEERIQRIDAMKPQGPQQEMIRARLYANTYFILADALFNLKDYAAADKVIKRAIENQKRQPVRTLQDQRDASDPQILAAMIAGRLGRFDEAQKIIAPVVKFHRGLYARGHDDLSQHVQLAQALYARALATPGQDASPDLTEASAILEGLPPAMRALIVVSIWRDRITDEKARRRQA